MSWARIEVETRRKRGSISAGVVGAGVEGEAAAAAEEAAVMGNAVVVDEDVRVEAAPEGIARADQARFADANAAADAPLVEEDLCYW
jgi:hypothetical protein